MLTLDDRTTLLANPRILAYSHFDNDLSVLEKCLKGRGTDRAGDFELGVALLLHFCGLGTASYGQIGALQEEIDLVAFSPSSNEVIAAECTTADLDVKEKLSKLSRRAKDLRARLATFSLIPIMFTALEESRVAVSDLQKAATEGIGVIAQQGINELLHMAGQRKESGEVLRYLTELIANQSSRFKQNDADVGRDFFASDSQWPFPRS